jgi:hypothetical protein
LARSKNYDDHYGVLSNLLLLPPTQIQIVTHTKLMFVYYVFLKKTKRGNVLKILLKSSVLTFQNMMENTMQHRNEEKVF